MVVSEFYCNQNLDCFGGLDHNGVVAVVLEGYTYIPAGCAMEVPQVYCYRLLVGNNVTP